jgi:fatty acid desaturase
MDGWLFTVRCLRGSRRLLEIVLLSLNALVSIIVILPLGWRGLALFVGSQLVASLYLGLIVAPNHKGMPVWTKGTRLSFLEKQVLSSRNVTSHPVWDFLYGGLNYQIEHHLFPTMPRVHFSRARAIIKPFCLAHGLPYEELDPLSSYRAAYAGLRLGKNVPS